MGYARLGADIKFIAVIHGAIAMSSAVPSPAELKSIRKRLARFSCLETPPSLSPEEAAEIRDSLMLFNELSDYQTLGICADTLAAGKVALEAYVAALSRPIQVEFEPRPGSVYIKFNTLKGAWYLDNYTGPSRGVLVSFHASEPEVELVNGTYGPFPLNLFE